MEPKEKGKEDNTLYIDPYTHRTQLHAHIQRKRNRNI